MNGARAIILIYRYRCIVSLSFIFFNLTYGEIHFFLFNIHNPVELGSESGLYKCVYDSYPFTELSSTVSYMMRVLPARTIKNRFVI